MYQNGTTMFLLLNSDRPNRHWQWKSVKTIKWTPDPGKMHSRPAVDKWTKQKQPDQGTRSTQSIQICTMRKKYWRNVESFKHCESFYSGYLHLLLDVGVSFGAFECGLADIFFTFVDNQICHTFWTIFNFRYIQVASIQQSSWNSTPFDFT